MEDPDDEEDGTMTNTADPSYYNQLLSYGLKIKRGELLALRMLAARRNMSVAQMIRESAVIPLTNEAYARLGAALPQRPKES